MIFRGMIACFFFSELYVATKASVCEVGKFEMLNHSELLKGKV
jgi:hypothetical protein